MADLTDYFSFQAFLIVLRETLESAIIISVLLAFLHQTFVTKPKTKTNPDGTYQSIEDQASSSLQDTNKAEEDICNEEMYRYLRYQVWIGGLLGLVVCLLIGTVILGVFYILGNDLWSIAEHYWEGSFSILASIIISIMGIKILRVNKMQQKWKIKLGRILNQSGFLARVRLASEQTNKEQSWGTKLGTWAEKYNMFILPFVTTLREGMEAIVFIGGIGINENTSKWAIINSVVSAIIIGCCIGVFLYRSGNSLSLQWFLVSSTCFLYLVAAGLFSKGIWNFELQGFINQCGGFDVSETGHGPGSYDVMKSVWHVNCCNGELQEDGALWMIVTAVFGWTNSATFGSVIGYNVYWFIIIIVFSGLLYEERHEYLPIVPLSWQQRRIEKRQSLYQAVASETSNNRASVDSVNSETPLR